MSRPTLTQRFQIKYADLFQCSSCPERVLIFIVYMFWSAWVWPGNVRRQRRLMKIIVVLGRVVSLHNVTLDVSRTSALVSDDDMLDWAEFCLRHKDDTRFIPEEVIDLMMAIANDRDMKRQILLNHIKEEVPDKAYRLVKKNSNKGNDHEQAAVRASD